MTVNSLIQKAKEGNKIKMERIALYNDSFQNWKTHDIKKHSLY